MEANKENMAKSSTKIPIPKKPLPSLPLHLIAGSNKDKTYSRKPLKTLNQPGPSKSEPKVKNKHVSTPFRIDTRYMTIRQDNGELDRDLIMINDAKNSSVILVSDDEDNLEDKIPHDIFSNGEAIQDSDAKKAVTPKLKTLEHKRIKNVKRSLKRPHSKELQGFSPEVKKEQKNDESDTFKRRLDFNERKDDELQPLDNLARSWSINEYTEDIFPYLLETEQNLLDVPKVPSVTRTCVINWLIKLNDIIGQPNVIQAAVKYFDTFLVCYNVRVHKLQLLAATCYWIAQKLNMPSVTATKMVKYSANAFTILQLMAAEKEVLKLLGFPRQPVVPQDFICYFTFYCDEKAPEEIGISATFLCLSGVLINKALGKEYPSVVAAAAVKNAVKLLKKEKETLMCLESSPVYQLAVKKTANFENLCFRLCEAVDTITTLSDYGALLKIYGCQPYYIAQRISMACKQTICQLHNM